VAGAHSQYTLAFGRVQSEGLWFVFYEQQVLKRLKFAEVFLLGVGVNCVTSAECVGELKYRRMTGQL